MEPERITFPADYPIKVIARASDDLRERLDEIFKRHFGAFGDHRVSVRDSAQSSFVALTYLMNVAAESQLQPLHAELQGTDGVIMVL
jgi:uncharacterized protein